MPLFELLRLSKAQERNPSPPVDEVVELVWENGQISTQIQSSRSRNIPLQPSSSRARETGSSSQVITKPTMDEIPMSVPSLMTGLSQDDDLVPWLNHQSLDGYCSDFLPHVSPVTVNDQETDTTAVNQTVFPLFQRRNNETESPLAETSHGCGTTTSCSSSLQYNGFQSHSLYDRTRNPVSQQVVCDESDRFTRTQDPLLPSNKPEVINFSHFLRPATLAKSNLNGKKGADHNEFQPSESRDEKGTQITANVFETRVIGAKDSEDKVVKDSVASAMPKDNEKTCLVSTDLSKRVQESEKAVEPAVVCSSVGSGNSLDGPLEAPSLSVKRKHSEIQENDCQSEDVEEESGDGRKAAPSQTGLGSKRSRSAEVHNLSERRRRDRINEKMRALQELIPNCNKVDKASMLDEAIEYLKSLQLQVQIMSMASGYYMPPVMYPHMATRIGPYPAAAMAMGMQMPYAIGVPDMNFAGSSRVPMLQVPMVNHGPQLFPASGMQQSVTAPRGFPSSSSGSKDQMKMKNDSLKAVKNGANGDQEERREASSDQFCGSS